MYVVEENRSGEWRDYVQIANREGARNIAVTLHDVTGNHTRVKRVNFLFPQTKPIFEIGGKS